MGHILSPISLCYDSKNREVPTAASAAFHRRLTAVHRSLRALDRVLAESAVAMSSLFYAATRRTENLTWTRVRAGISASRSASW